MLEQLKKTEKMRYNNDSNLDILLLEKLKETNIPIFVKAYDKPIKWRLFLGEEIDNSIFFTKELLDVFPLLDRIRTIEIGFRLNSHVDWAYQSVNLHRNRMTFDLQKFIDYFNDDAKRSVAQRINEYFRIKESKLIDIFNRHTSLLRECINTTNVQFDTSGQLPESQQSAAMTTWDEEKRLKYMAQNTLTDRQTFEPILGTEVWFEEAYSKAKYPDEYKNILWDNCKKHREMNKEDVGDIESIKSLIDLSSLQLRVLDDIEFLCRLDVMGGLDYNKLQLQDKWLEQHPNNLTSDERIQALLPLMREPIIPYKLKETMWFGLFLFNEYYAEDYEP